MARGTQFSVLLSRLRSETGRSDNLAVGADDLAVLKEAINAIYATLYNEYDWSHLKKVFDRITLTAGTRYYDFPDGLNSERVLKAVVWRDGIPTDIERGIDFEDYAYYSSEDDARGEPAQKWDVRWTGETDQIEIWPLPSTNNQTLQFIGIQDAPRLVANDDICLLDDDLVVGFAAAEVLGEKSSNGAIKLKRAQGHLKMLKARNQGAGATYQMGLGRDTQREKPTIVLRIG